ncbi:MAG: nitrilase-related carbon-nitrogen hydrolase, partial [Terriglobia bacterium]
MTVAGIQARATTDKAANLAKAERLVRQAARKGARIICLPELYRTLYFPQYEKQDVGDFAE